jgi:predicted acetyltransferase
MGLRPVPRSAASGKGSSARLRESAYHAAGGSSSVNENGVTLVPIEQSQSQVLASLLELYVHDFSEHVPVELKPNGRFDLPLDERWFTSAEHFPFFVHHAGGLAGFALVRRGSRVTSAPDVMDVAEFFVVRGARRRGVGQAAAHALFARFPGVWEIRVRRTASSARTFWSQVARSWQGHAAELTAFFAQGVEWELLTLDSRRP